jgi:hypothetical protein
VERLPRSNDGDDEMKTTIELAREAGFETMLRKGKILGFDRDGDYTEELKAFEALVRADERWEQSKRRGVLAFCPYTGKPRHPSDIASDPHGILILVPDQPIRGMK